MCGLFGGASTFLSKFEKEKVLELGFLSQLRGTDSTGLAVVCNPLDKESKKSTSNGKTHYIIKDAMNASNFFMSKNVHNLVFESTATQVILGHCRSATLGAVNKVTAHPYRVGPIMGMHNGTVQKFAPPKDKIEEETDSLILYRTLHEHGLQEMYIRSEEGPMALTWTDASDNSYNIFRNDGRTLFGYKIGNTLYWASEKRFITFAMPYIDEKNVFLFDPLTHYKFRLGSVECTETKISPPEKKTFSMPPFKYKGGKSSGTHSTFCIDGEDGWEQMANGSFRKTYGASSSKNTSTSKERKEAARISRQAAKQDEHWKHTIRGTTPIVSSSNIIPFDNASLPRAVEYIGFNGNHMNLVRAEEVLSCGCAVCNNASDLTDIVYFVEPGAYVCGECYKPDEPTNSTNQFILEYCGVIPSCGGLKDTVERHLNTSKEG